MNECLRINLGDTLVKTAMHGLDQLQGMNSQVTIKNSPTTRKLLLFFSNSQPSQLLTLLQKLPHAMTQLYYQLKSVRSVFLE